jgi:hypothetical protein
VGQGGATAVIVNGEQKGPVLVVSANKSVRLEGLTLTNGLARNGNGGGIANLGGAVSVADSRITHNSATAEGGPFTDLGFGGGIFNFDNSSIGPNGPVPGNGPGSLELVRTLVIDNRASNGGGGVSTISFVGATSGGIFDSTIAENVSVNGGAGGVQNCGTLVMKSSVIRDNTALQGGGLTNCGGPPPGNAQLINTLITRNHAVGPPGGVSGGPPMLGGHGGGISNGGMLTLTSSPVTNNTATGSGGGIFNLAPGTVSRSNSPVTGNTPPQCAGLSC